MLLPVAHRFARAVKTLQYYGSTYATPSRGDVVMAADLTNLRGQVAALRQRYGLPAYQWTDPEIVPRETVIKAVHIQELRAAVDEVNVRLGRPLPLFDALGPPIRLRDFGDVHRNYGHGLLDDICDSVGDLQQRDEDRDAHGHAGRVRDASA